jgi:polar amino acid transport system substrate-binding protein
MARTVARLFSLCILLAASPVFADALDDILERGTIRVGVSEFVPWTMKTTAGDLVGFEIDVAKKIATDMGVKAEFKLYDWSEIIPALNKGEIDIIAGGMAMTPARALQVNFTRPTAESGIGIATNTEMTAAVTSFAGLNDPKIIVATVADTYAASVAEMFFNEASVNTFRSVEQAEEQVIKGRAHVYLAGMSEARFLALKHPDLVDIPIAEPLVAQSEGLAVRKGEQELLNFLNTWVTARQTDRWLPTTRDYWFESMTWAMEDK